MKVHRYEVEEPKFRRFLSNTAYVTILQRQKSLNTIILFIVVTALVSPIVSQLNNDEQTLCVTGQKLRNKFCCWTTQCEDQGFLPCDTHNGTDVCEQCPDGEYVRDVYPTKGLERSPCVEIPRCLQEEVRDDSGKCVCNRAEGYIRKLDYCEPTDIQCDKPGIELSEQDESIWRDSVNPAKRTFIKMNIASIYASEKQISREYSFQKLTKWVINILKIRKGSAETSVSPTFAVNRRLNKNEEKNQRKISLSILSGQNVDDGNTKTDRTCIEVTIGIQRTTTGNSITTASNPGSSNDWIRNYDTFLPFSAKEVILGVSEDFVNSKT
ncbi:hypothetical protein AM593_05233, partial [Mytilus galloprovincialis]